MMTYIDGVVVDVLENAGVVVDLSLEESWWGRSRTLGRVSRLQVETGRRAHLQLPSRLTFQYLVILTPSV